MEDETLRQPASVSEHMEIANLPDACLKKLHEFERELNKEGYWNIALVAYQLNG